MEFDLTDLHLFVLTADEGKLTRAAAARHLSLAAASARIKALEDQAGLPLFYREARGVRLTPAGVAFLHHARGMLHQAEQLRADLQEYGGGLRGHLRVFANTTAVTDFLPEILPGFLNDNPNINIDLQEKPNAEIARGVLDGRADIGIVPESTARRNQASLGIALIELTDAWSVRERFILVRNREALPRYAESLIETLIDPY